MKIQELHFLLYLTDMEVSVNNIKGKGTCLTDKSIVLGQNVAKYSSQKLPSIVIDSEDFKKGDYKEALRKGFFQIDTDLLQGG